MADLKHKNFIEKLSILAERNDPINPDLYQKYDVKRGLRNANGTGVLVGLTRIGDVVGYEVGANKEKIPVPGRLLYRGYDVVDLIRDAEANDDYCYEQCAYLLLFGELPKKSELDEFRAFIGESRTLPPNFTEDMIMKAPSQDIMNKLARGVLASYSYDENPEDRSVANNLRQCIELISRFSTLAAYGYQARRRYYENKSMYIHNPLPELSTAENFLHLIRPDCQYTKLEAEILDLALILHAEHGGGNNSTFTTHVVTSAGTDTYSAITAALCSLKGPRHGGANIKVMEMMADIKKHVKDWNDKEELRNYLSKILNGEVFDKAGLIYGMGHAVYTVSDPRAEVFKGFVEQLAKEKGMQKVFKLYNNVEKISQKLIMEKRKTFKPVSANVDCYSGFVYDMLGLPVELFTPMFAIARMGGWAAHRIEELLNNGKIIRPAYVSTNGRKEYQKIDDRK